MSYLSEWVSKLTEGHTLTADDIAVLRRVQMCIESADKHHQQARDAAANAAEKMVVTAAVDLVDSLDHYDSLPHPIFMFWTGREMVIEAKDNLRVAVANLLAVEGGS